MLAYPILEAEELLQTKLEGASKALEACEEDLDYLREQITVSRFIPLPRSRWDDGKADGIDDNDVTDAGSCDCESI